MLPESTGSAFRTSGRVTSGTRHASYLLAAGVHDRTASDRLVHADPAYMKRAYVYGIAQARAAELLMKSPILGIGRRA
jgi:hypothetical protein